MNQLDELLIYLAKSGAMYKEIELSTIKISKDIKKSQQTISRRLIDLEEHNLIERTASTRGIKIKVTEKGIESLKSLYLELKNIFGEKAFSFIGAVESGLGEGSYYVSLPEYEKQFKEKLGFIPFKGTLNLRVDYATFLQFITSQKKITINGFNRDKRTFGPIVAYKITIDKISAAIIIPKRTSHERDIIEIIAPLKLRSKLHLSDKDKLEVKSI